MNEVFRENSFSVQSYLNSSASQQSYLQYEHSSLPISYPNDELTVQIVINKQSNLLYDDQNVSIFGQLIWSWAQFCPLLIIFLFAVNEILRFAMREGLLRRTVIEDRDYIETTEKRTA